MNIVELPTVTEVQQEMQTLMGCCKVTEWQASNMLRFFVRHLDGSMTVEPGMLEQDSQ